MGSLWNMTFLNGMSTFCLNFVQTLNIPSSVHGHWLLARAAALFPGTDLARNVSVVFDQQFTAEKARLTALGAGGGKNSCSGCWRVGLLPAGVWRLLWENLRLGLAAQTSRRVGSKCRGFLIKQACKARNCVSCGCYLHRKVLYTSPHHRPYTYSTTVLQYDPLELKYSKLL